VSAQFKTMIVSIPMQPFITKMINVLQGALRYIPLFEADTIVGVLVSPLIPNLKAARYDNEPMTTVVAVNTFMDSSSVMNLEVPTMPEYRSLIKGYE